MKCTFKILLFCIVSCNQLFSGNPEPMSPDAIIEQAVRLGYVPVTDLTDKQLERLIEESQERLAQAKEQRDKEIEDSGVLGLEA